MLKGDVRRFLSSLVGRYQGLQTRLCTELKDLELVDEIGSLNREDKEKTSLKSLNLEEKRSKATSVQEDLARLQEVLKDIQKIYTIYLELDLVERSQAEEEADKEGQEASRE